MEGGSFLSPSIKQSLVLRKLVKKINSHFQNRLTEAKLKEAINMFSTSFKDRDCRI